MTLAIEVGDRFDGTAPAIIGVSAPIRRLREMIATMAGMRLPVLLLGPTGAGKELVAEALHLESRRRGAFVPFNVCALGETMFEDALFGHVRGAFTGAVQDSFGFLREADGGTVFLDEVSGLSRPLQAKLLRAIETGVFRPVGARRDVKSEFRVIAATNEPIDALVANGQFRADLAHRLGGVTIHVPSLAERMDDLPLLVQHFAERHGAPSPISDGVMEALRGYSWPGNVRELRHVVEQAIAYGGGRMQTGGIRAILDARRTSGRLPTASAFEAAERLALLEALDLNQWDTALAAQHLCIHRATLYRRMKRVGLVTGGVRFGDSHAFAEVRANARESARMRGTTAGGNQRPAIT